MKSHHLKYHLMYYFRFIRQWICATECLNGDVVAFTGTDVHEVEVKISKSDLWNGEAKKEKHKQFGDEKYQERWYYPTKFSLAVPEELQAEAEKWVLATNEKYGIFIYSQRLGLTVVRKAKRFATVYNKDWERHVMMRVCAENIGHLQKKVYAEIHTTVPTTAKQEELNVNLHG